MSTLPDLPRDPESLLKVDSDLLLGRLAVHYKLITMEELVSATREQERLAPPKPRLGEILVRHRLVEAQQVEQLLQVQQQFLAKQKARIDEQREELAREQAQALKRGRVIRVGESGPAHHPPIEESLPAMPTPQDPLDLLLQEAVRIGASDIHVHQEVPVKLRVQGRLVPPPRGSWDAAELESIMLQRIGEHATRTLRTEGEVDVVLHSEGVGRFRGNLYQQHRGLDAVWRLIPDRPPTLTELNLPMDWARFTAYHQGLVLVTGPGGSGKTSTLAALVNIVNEERTDHVVTIEEPVEYQHPPKRSVVNQRQVGVHTFSYARALKASLREDPDVIVIGELRDAETIALALTAAETGHLVLATMHTRDAVRTVNRVVGAFPASQHAQVRTMLSESLRVVICQRLVEAADHDGRLPAYEVLVVNRAVSNLIREDKLHQVRSVMQTAGPSGMCLLDDCLTDLVKRRKVTQQEARRHAAEPERFPVEGEDAR